MTAPTPQEVIHDLHVGFPETRRSALIQDAIAALAAVTAERDQARQQQDITKWALEQTQASLDQARQMLADAPHDSECWIQIAKVKSRPCTCWKSGL